ncbi:latent-transforming growth factor beta-binding protein 1-like [Pocillopora verrucosa]|uniref:latent-transforming growth factor beta-binding protein 1-like n=1 Tax=Pocillopora verrucosa TaxID=203993 RepID=UPI003340310C
MEGECICTGMYVGNGRTCRKSRRLVSCKKTEFCGDKASCLIDPLPPKTPICKCWLGYKFNDKQVCVAINQPCKVDRDCTPQAKCEHGLCICQGGRMGDGYECRGGWNCSDYYFGCKNAWCYVDPDMPREKLCKCLPNQVHKFASNKQCVDCVTDRHCKGAERCEDYKCKKPDLRRCDRSSDCHQQAECRRGMCHCTGLTAGNGLNCTESLPCPVTHECDANSVCITHPKYPFNPYCKCKAHYEKSNDGACVDIDECSSNPCPAKHVCVDKIGAFECHCKKGYKKGDGDECVKMKCKCGPHGSKCDDDGECSCYDGFEKNGEGVCEEMKCKCGPHGSKCDGDGECSCYDGFEKNGEGVCKEMKCKCGPHGSKCDGDGECSCYDGFEKNGEGVCEDMKCKCGLHGSKCDGDGECSCYDGFEKNGEGVCEGPAGQVGSGHSVHVTSHLSTLGLVLTLLGRLAVTA